MWQQGNSVIGNFGKAVGETTKAGPRPKIAREYVFAIAINKTEKKAQTANKSILHTNEFTALYDKGYHTGSEFGSNYTIRILNASNSMPLEMNLAQTVLLLLRKNGLKRQIQSE